MAISDAYCEEASRIRRELQPWPLSVVYQPARTTSARKSGCAVLRTRIMQASTVLFKGADDPERAQPLEAEIDIMVHGMSKTWDTREDQLVKAVEDGKYLWVEVDLDRYKDAANQCLKIWAEATKPPAIRNTLRGEIEALNSRTARSGVVHDENQGAVRIHDHPAILITFPPASTPSKSPLASSSASRANHFVSLLLMSGAQRLLGDLAEDRCGVGVAVGLAVVIARIHHDGVDDDLGIVRRGETHEARDCRLASEIVIRIGFGA